MKICAISDIHGNLIENIDLCDYLLIAGDISPVDIQKNADLMYNWIKDEFIEWASNLPVKKKIIFIAGNHDFIFDLDLEYVKNLFVKTNIEYLNTKISFLERPEDEIDVENQKFKYISLFGTPYCHYLPYWAFCQRDETLKLLYDYIPDSSMLKFYMKKKKIKDGECGKNLDILLSHDAAYGYSDICYGLFPLNNCYMQHIGARLLRRRLEKVSPEWHIHGHLHSANHEVEEMQGNKGMIKTVNVSILDEDYQVAYEPFYFDI